MNKAIRIIMLVIVNQFLATQLGIDSYKEIFWFTMVSLTGMVYGIIVMLDKGDNNE